MCNFSLLLDYFAVLLLNLAAAGLWLAGNAPPQLEPQKSAFTLLKEQGEDEANTNANENL